MNSIAKSSAINPHLPTSESISETKSPLSIHAYLPVAFFYFFLNQAGLPLGAFYSMFFTPLVYLWLYSKGQRWLTTKLFLFLFPFFLAHLFLGIDSPLYYFRSVCIMWSAYITAYGLCFALLRTSNIDRLFDELIGLNFYVALLAVALLRTPLSQVFWHSEINQLASGSQPLRLSVLTSEPSVYANLMLPLLMFAALRLICYGGKRNTLYLLMISVPFLLCQSFGGISICAAGIATALFSGRRRLVKHRKALLFAAGLGLVFVALLLTPNPISARVVQVISGGDSSTNSRTIYSFLASYNIAASKSLWWGAGMGQGKLVDLADLGIGFSVGITPNTLAGTFAEMGIIGVIARITIEIFLFFKTKVYLDSFRLAMFVVAFLVQSTGSYTVDVQQCLMWCFAFFSFFPAINLRNPVVQETSLE